MMFSKLVNSIADLVLILPLGDEIKDRLLSKLYDVRDLTSSNNSFS